MFFLIIIFNVYSLEFLREIPDAREICLGFSDISKDNLNMITVNPSSLPGRHVFSFGTQDFASLARYYLIGFSYPFKNLNFGFLWVRAEVGEIPEYPELPENDTIPKDNLGYFSEFEEAFILPIKHKKIPLTFQIKIINKRLKDLKGKGIGFDIGYKRGFKIKSYMFFTGFSLLNPFGSKITWSSGKKDEEARKINFFLNVKKYFFKKFYVLVTAKAGYDVEPFYSTGLEMNFFKYFSLLIGWKQEPRFGVGFNFEKFEVYYSFRKHELGRIQSITLKLKP